MQTENLKVRQISEAAFDWYKGYLATIDEKDLDGFGAYLADECIMVQNNREPVSGKAAILDGLKSYWQSFAKVTHDLLNIYGNDHAFALEAYNHYTRLDAKKISVRAVALTDRDERGLVKHFRFYTDVSPVFADVESTRS